MLVADPVVEYFDVEQGSIDWHQLRAGCITASNFGTAMSRLRNGEYSAEAKALGFRLAIERISRELLDVDRFENFAMRRGNRLEPVARLKHEARIGQLIETPGMVRTLDGLYGASPDGLIGLDGGSEYKCLVDPSRIGSILLDGDISEFLPQVQGGMWLTKRTWWHFCLYCPALEPVGKDLTVFEVERDDNYVEDMALQLAAFNGYVEQLKESIAAAETYYPSGKRLPARPDHNIVF